MRIVKIMQIPTAVVDWWRTYFNNYRILTQLVKLEPERHITKLASPECSFIEDKTTIHLGKEKQTPYIVNKLFYRTISNMV
jgi:hypothetical protein